jgi:tetratricopeptide (TPR) repeat protein
MRCLRAQEYISRSVDGGLSGRESARLERHLAGCGECRALREDLRKIVAGAAGLATPGPSDRVWSNIRAGLETGAARANAQGLKPERRPFFGLSVPAFRLAGAAALAVVLVAAGVVVGRRLGRQDAPLSAAAKGGEAYTLAKLDEAERHYEQAIKALGEAFAADKDGLAPAVVELFDRNLSVVDATIQACRAAVRTEPDDLEARNYLLAAYTRKITLLDAALDLRSGDRDAAVGKTII